MANAAIVETLHATQYDEPQVRWIGHDSRGIELEIIGIVLPNLLLVIHAMPTAFRRRP